MPIWVSAEALVDDEEDDPDGDLDLGLAQEAEGVEERDVPLQTSKLMRREARVLLHDWIDDRSVRANKRAIG